MLICKTAQCGDFTIAQQNGQLYVAEHCPVTRTIFSSIYGWVLKYPISQQDLANGLLHQESILTIHAQAWTLKKAALLGRLAKKFCTMPQVWQSVR